MGILHRIDDMTGQNNKTPPTISVTENKTKLEQLSDTCEETIYAGTDVKLKDGNSYRFSYTLKDQANISEMFNACLAGATGYVYHYDDGSCRTFEAADILTIYYTLSLFKTGQTTYFNQLKQYISTLDDLDEINSIIYGQPLTEPYQEQYNYLMGYAKSQLDSVVSNIVAAKSKESYYASYTV